MVPVCISSYRFFEAHTGSNLKESFSCKQIFSIAYSLTILAQAFIEQRSSSELHETRNREKYHNTLSNYFTVFLKALESQIGPRRLALRTRGGPDMGMANMLAFKMMESVN